MRIESVLEGYGLRGGEYNKMLKHAMASDNVDSIDKLSAWTKQRLVQELRILDSNKNKQVKLW